jgi:hypothetical protein
LVNNCPVALPQKNNILAHFLCRGRPD